MRLIDADELKELYQDCKELKVPCEVILANIDDMPTAYDVVKAVEQFNTIMRGLYDKLAYYKDLEEQGRLIELPCKPFEKVWIAHTKFMRVFEISYASNSDILADMEKGFIIAKTKEEAEAKLKEAGEQND